MQNIPKYLEITALSRHPLLLGEGRRRPGSALAPLCCPEEGRGRGGGKERRAEVGREEQRRRGKKKTRRPR